MQYTEIVAVISISDYTGDTEVQGPETLHNAFELGLETNVPGFARLTDYSPRISCC